MANLIFRNIPVSLFFQYASGLPEFDLVDIVNEAERISKISFIDDDGFFVYKTQMIVNDRKASLFGINGLSFQVYSSNPDKFEVSEEDALASFDVDFETHDEIVKTIAGNTENNAVKTKTSNVSIMRVFANSNIAKIDPVSTPSTPFQKTSSSYKKNSKKVKAYGMDPAALAAVGNFATLNLENAASLSQKSDESTVGLRKSRALHSQKMLTGKSLRQVRGSLRAARRGNQSNQIARSKDTRTQTSTATKTTVFELLPAKRLVERYIYISKEKIQGAAKLYVRVSPIISRPRNYNFIVKKSTVYHDNQLMNFLSNPEPPEIMISAASYSSVELIITRTDPALSQVRVIRIIENPHMVRPSFENLVDLDFSGENTLTFSDRVDNIKPNKILYRFAVINGDGSLGDFSSIVIPSVKKISDPKKSAAVPVSIFAHNEIDSVRISVNTLESDIFSLRLLRQEFGKVGSFDQSIISVPPEDEKYETLIAGSKSVTSFRDKNTVLGKKYRYFVAYRVGTQGDSSLGEEIISDEDELIIRRFPIDTIPFSVTVSDPDISSERMGLPSASFSIDVVEETELFNAIIKALRDAGIGEQFLSELQADKMKARNFLMFIVERYEISSGRRVSFGITPAGVFSDSDGIRRHKKLPPPFPGERYIYVFKVCMQDPSSFLQNSTVSLSTRLETEIKKKAGRFSRKIYSRLGVLPPEAEVRYGVSIERLIEESQFGIEIVKNVFYPKTIPSIKLLDVKKSSFFSKLFWGVKGDTRDISYFNVYCTINGEENLLGAIAAAPESGFYSFKDDRYHAAVGEKSYQIKAVSFSDDESVSSTTVKDSKGFSIPDNMVVGNVFGSFGSKNKIKSVAPGVGKHKSLYTPKPTPPGKPPKYFPDNTVDHVQNDFMMHDVMDNQILQDDFLEENKPKFGQDNLFLEETMEYSDNSFSDQSFAGETYNDNSGGFSGQDIANQEDFAEGTSNPGGNNSNGGNGGDSGGYSGDSYGDNDMNLMF